MDLAYQSNYWFSFPGSNSDVILGLTLWQYWWWFWFTFYITLYYFLFSQLIRQRLLKFSPRITTSQKAHGKWGDFIICFVPIAWCVNILSNSNFILRMLEWQTESSLFTIRIRGRQWYWVYKIELADLLKAKDVALEVGLNKWEVNHLGSSDMHHISINALQLRQLNKDYLKNYKQLVTSMNMTLHSYSTGVDVGFNSNRQSAILPIDSLSIQPGVGNAVAARLSAAFKLTNSGSFISSVESTNSVLRQIPTMHRIASNSNIRFKRLPFYSQTVAANLLQLNNDVTVAWVAKGSNFTTKPVADNLYFVLKQKRFAPQIRKVANVVVNKPTAQLFVKDASVLSTSIEAQYSQKWLTKRLKARTGLSDLTMNRRLLRTRRTLVLPTNINLTVITNSFDVVHSWYIPGLGIKLDCIPGRSTHHTLNIEHAGFYYGQCAEICGRYHHHMPIRVCALPFEHFMVWWYHYGLPYFNATRVSRKSSTRAGILASNV